MEKVLIGMSGGVDSSVAAALLKKQGYDVTGATMLLWNDTEKAAEDAKRVCEHIGIDFITIDFRDEFRERVVDYFVNEYINGRTPNPCIMCNKYLKFGKMLDYALDNGYNYIATGHYGKIVNNNNKFFLLFLKRSHNAPPQFDLYNRNPLISLIRDKIVLQLQLIIPGSVSITLCRKCSISSLDEATACTCNLSLPVTR